MTALLIVGLAVGIAAKFLMPGRSWAEILITALLGVEGAWIAGASGHSFGWYHVEEPLSLFGAAAGAAIVLFLYKILRPTEV